MGRVGTLSDSLGLLLEGYITLRKRIDLKIVWTSLGILGTLRRFSFIMSF